MSTASCPPADSRRRTQWIHPRPSFFLPVKVLSRVFRGQVRRRSEATRFAPARSRFPETSSASPTSPPSRALLRTLFRHDWVVYAKPPFGGPEHVLHYLARYTHRVAISNHRLVACGRRPGDVSVEGLRHGSKVRLMTLSAEEFLRRFCLHVLPKASSGFASSASWRLAAAPRHCHAAGTRSTRSTTAAAASVDDTSTRCPCRRVPRCGGAMVAVERLTARQTRRAALRSKDSRLTPRERHTVDIRRACRAQRPIRRRVPAVASEPTPPPRSSRLTLSGVASGHSPATTEHSQPQHLSAPAPASLRFNAHTDRPRPPQTPAASFKRLYRE